MDFSAAVAQVIRRRRLENGLPQRELAFLCGIDPITISRIERGEGSPSLSTFWLLAKALRSTPAELSVEIDSLTDQPRLVEPPAPHGYRKAILPAKTAKRATRKKTK